MSIDDQFAGIIGVSDAPRAEAAAVVRALDGMGIDVWMMSGDQPRTAHAVARTLGIDPARVLGGLLPADKVHHVSDLQKRGKIVAMVGDGVNDSPALAQAHVGIGLASGTDVAMESAQVVLIKSHLQDVLTAIDLSRVTFARIRLNFAWAMMYNVVGILLAAGAFYAAGRVAVSPAFAGLSELLSSLPVVCFSLLLSTYKPTALAQPTASTPP
jgi:Cu+-exporting ATPase